MNHDRVKAAFRCDDRGVAGPYQCDGSVTHEKRSCRFIPAEREPHDASPSSRTSIDRCLDGCCVVCDPITLGAMRLDVQDKVFHIAFSFFSPNAMPLIAAQELEMFSSL